MIRKEIPDYVPEVTRITNEYYQKTGMTFTEKEVEKILTTVMSNIYPFLKKERDIEITGFFKIFFSKSQKGKRLWFKNGRRKVFERYSYKDEEKEFFKRPRKY